MKKEVIQELYNSFEAVAVEVEGIECWSACELQLLWGYSNWENFSKVIDKAKIGVSPKTQLQAYSLKHTIS